MNTIVVEETITNVLEAQTPQAIIAWAVETFGEQLCVTSSFQTQSVPLLHMLSEIAPQVPILFLDTGFHFPETLLFRDQLVERLGLNVRVLKPDMGHAGFLRRYGQLHSSDPDLCCQINKVVPLKQALSGYGAWISGVRRDQTPARRDTPVVSVQDGGRYKVCPMVNWTKRNVWQYMDAHELPTHPLFEQGYASIGCGPCTRPVFGDDVRSGRWGDQAKTECGIHTQI